MPFPKLIYHIYHLTSYLFLKITATKLININNPIKINVAALVFAKISALNSKENFKDIRDEIISEIKDRIEKGEDFIDKNFSKNREENHVIAKNNREEIKQVLAEVYLKMKQLKVFIQKCLMI